MSTYKDRASNTHLMGPEGLALVTPSKHPQPTAATEQVLPIPQSLNQLIQAGSEEIVNEYILKPMAAAAVARVSDRPQLLKDAMALMLTMEDQTDG